jgi:hypothetical protein
MSAREADEEAKHGEVLRWGATMHYVTTGLPNALASLLILFWRPILTLFFIASDDEVKSQDVGDGRTEDVEERKSADGEEDSTVTQAQTSDDEKDNIPIAASIGGAPKAELPATRKRKEK